MDEYTVYFDIDCISKRGMISRKSGEVDVTTDATEEELLKSQDLKILIASEMEKKVKKAIFNVDIREISKN